jgi:hypothetical protein
MNKKETIERLNRCITDCDHTIEYYRRQLQREDIDKYKQDWLDMIDNQEEQKVKYKELIDKIEKLDIE